VTFKFSFKFAYPTLVDIQVTRGVDSIDQRVYPTCAGVFSGVLRSAFAIVVVVW